ncbi:MAG: hypothetical protein HFI68_07770 [Lachnospiraceae bacterium]|nr:hypothetical protein [Lachnospiraceae bacterium]
MKKERIFLVFFCIILAVPLLFSDKVGGRVSADENRYLAKFPELTLHAGIKKEFEDWINDNAAGRTYLRKIYNYANINLLKARYDGVNLYEGDWVFLMNDIVTFYYLQKGDVMDQTRQETWIQDYKRVRDFLAQRHVSMCSVVYPHKSEVYAERFQDYIIPLSEKGQLDVFREMAESNPDLNMKVLYDLFKLKTDNGEQLYSKAYDHAHWNNQGAWLGYQELMEMVQKEIPEVRILTETDVEISECERTSRYYGRTYTETDLEYKVREPQGTEDPSWFDSVGYESADQWKSYRYYKNKDGTLPKILIIGDSYTWMFMLPWISESFSETVFIHEADSGNLNLMMDLLSPDIVVFAGLQNCVTNSVGNVASAIQY